MIIYNNVEKIDDKLLDCNVMLTISQLRWRHLRTSSEYFGGRAFLSADISSNTSGFPQLFIATVADVDRQQQRRLRRRRQRRRRRRRSRIFRGCLHGPTTFRRSPPAINYVNTSMKETHLIKTRRLQKCFCEKNPKNHRDIRSIKCKNVRSKSTRISKVRGLLKCK